MFSINSSQILVINLKIKMLVMLKFSPEHTAKKVKLKLSIVLLNLRLILYSKVYCCS